MASNDPGFAMMPAAEDPRKGSIKDEDVLADQCLVAPDQFDESYETSKWEIIAYYLYYIGNNGLPLFNFAPTAFQNLLSEAAGDAGTIRFAGAERTINSTVLVCNGISFAIQIVIFLIIGSYAGGTYHLAGEMRLTAVRFRTFATQYPHRAFSRGFRHRIWMAGGTHSSQLENSCRHVHRGL